MNLKKTFFWLLTCSFSTLYAQKAAEKTTKPALVALHFGGGFYVPAADLSKRFGADQDLHLTLDFLTKTNWLLGAEAQFFFSNTVKEDPLKKLRTPQGFLIGNNRELADVQLKERGQFFGGFVGRVFSFENSNRANGLRATLGAGWMRHKIRIQDDTQSALQVDGTYKKGYDRLSGGLALTQFLAWQYLSRQRRVNFFIGLEAMEGFTKSLRDWDFELEKKDVSKRLDLRFGLKLGWTIPFYLNDKGEDIFY